MTWVRPFLIALAALFLSSCLAPDKFTATLVIHRDGTYELQYTGDVISLSSTEDDRPAGAKADTPPEDMAQALRELGFSGTYRGALRSSGAFTWKGDVTKETETFVPEAGGGTIWFSFHRFSNGEYAISLRDMEDSHAAALRKKGIKGQGTICIKPDKGVKVVDSNGMRPLPGVLTPCHHWTIEDITRAKDAVTFSFLLP